MDRSRYKSSVNFLLTFIAATINNGWELAESLKHIELYFGLHLLHFSDSSSLWVLFKLKVSCDRYIKTYQKLQHIAYRFDLRFLILKRCQDWDVNELLLVQFNTPISASAGSPKGWLIFQYLTQKRRLQRSTLHQLTKVTQQLDCRPWSWSVGRPWGTNLLWRFLYQLLTPPVPCIACVYTLYTDPSK